MSDNFLPFTITGKVLSQVGPVIKSVILGVKVGDFVTIQGISPTDNAAVNIPAKIISFEKELAVISPFNADFKIIPGSKVIAAGSSSQTINIGCNLLGCVTDSLGKVMERSTDSKHSEELRRTLPEYEVEKLIIPVPSPLSRERITNIFETGIRAIDGFLTVGQGQRIAMFAQPGVGKSSLISSIAGNSKADVNVIGLIGERGRETADFMNDLPETVRAKTVLVVSTSSEPAISRITAAYTATRIAEYYCSKNLNVLLQIDSLTRLFRAYREVGLAAGEVPVRRGYPPSVFAELPNLIERPGNFKGKGSITAFYTVLLSSDLDEDPMVDEIKGLTDGHFILKAPLARRGIFPAVDVLSSISRLGSQVLKANESGEVVVAKRGLSSFLENLERDKEIFSLGGVVDDEKFKKSLELETEIENFLKQGIGEQSTFSQTKDVLLGLWEGVGKIKGHNL